jgi:hypothetical protein
MNKINHIKLSFASRIIGVITGMVGFYFAGFVDPRIGGMLIAIGSLLIALPSKWE